MPAKQPQRPPIASPATAFEMCRILVLSEQELVTLTKAGVLKRSIERRGGRDRIVYDKDDNIERYIRHLREPERRAREEFMKEKRDTARIVREHKELDLMFARGDVFLREPALIAVMNMLSIVKNQFLTLPVRCTRLLVGQTDPVKVRELLKNHCMLALRSLIDFDLDSAMKGSRNGHNAEDKGTKKRRDRVDARRDRRA